VKRESTSAREGVRRVDSSIDNLGNTAGKVKRLLGGLFAGLLGAAGIKKATDLIGGFEMVMAQISGVTSATADQMARMEKTTRELGATTTFSAKQAAEGMLFLARAGFGVDKSIGALPATLNLASAGVMDLGSAADIASNVVQQFGLSAEDTVRVVDTLVNTANAANTDVTQFAEAMKFVGPVAAGAGKSVEEAAAAIGVLSDAGIQSTMAGTGLRRVILSLLTPAKEAADTLASMGLTLEDVNPVSNDLATVFERLKGANMGLTEAAKIFDTQTATSALILSKATDKMRGLTKANEEAAGVAKRNADIMKNTWVGSIKSLISAVSELVIKLGKDSGLIGTVRVVVDSVTDVVLVLAGMEDCVKGNVKQAEYLATAIKVVTVAASTFIALQFPRYLLMIAKAFKLVALAAVANPLIAMATAISFVVGALVTFRDKTITIGDTTFTIAEKVKAAWVWLKDTLGPIFEQMRVVVVTAWGAITEFFQASLSTITSFLADTWKYLVDATSWLVSTMNTILQSIGLPTLKDMFSDLVEAVRDWQENILYALIAVEFAFKNWQDVASLNLLRVELKIREFWDLATHVFTKAIPKLLVFLKDNWKAVFLDIGDLMLTILKNSFKAIGNLFENLWKTLTLQMNPADFLSSLKEDFSSKMLEGFTPELDSSDVDSLLKSLTTVDWSKATQSLRGDIDDITKDLDTRLQEFYVKRRQELADMFREAAKAAEDATGTTKTPETKPEFTKALEQTEQLLKGMSTDAKVTAEKQVATTDRLLAARELFQAQEEMRGRADTPAVQTASNTTKMVSQLSVISDKLSGPLNVGSTDFMEAIKTQLNSYLAPGVAKTPVPFFAIDTNTPATVDKNGVPQGLRPQDQPTSGDVTQDIASQLSAINAALHSLGGTTDSGITQDIGSQLSVIREAFLRSHSLGETIDSGITQDMVSHLSAINAALHSLGGTIDTSTPATVDKNGLPWNLQPQDQPTSGGITQDIASQLSAINAALLRSHSLGETIDSDITQYMASRLSVISEALKAHSLGETIDTSTPATVDKNGVPQGLRPQDQPTSDGITQGMVDAVIAGISAESSGGFIGGMDLESILRKQGILWQEPLDRLSMASLSGEGVSKAIQDAFKHATEGNRASDIASALSMLVDTNTAPSGFDPDKRPGSPVARTYYAGRNTGGPFPVVSKEVVDTAKNTKEMVSLLRGIKDGMGNRDPDAAAAILDIP
jgi:TP901 family phage tail tape measure protein